MPITIFAPNTTTGGAVGPGALISVRTDFVGPFPSDAVWDFQVLGGPTFERVYWDQRFSCTGPIFKGYLGEGSLENMAQLDVGIVQRALQNEPVHLVARLAVPSTGFLEQQSFTSGVYDETATMPRLFQAGVPAQVPEQLLVDASDSATQTTRVFEQGITSVSIPVADLLLHPPLGLLKLSISPGVLSGVGRIQLFGQPVDVAYGLWWSIVEVPIGFGLTEGVINEFEQRLIQLRVVHNIAGQLICSEFLDANFAEVLFTWHEFKPYAIDFHITPGVVLDVRLLTL